MIILGIDPGTASTGYGVIRKLNSDKKSKVFRCVEYGVIRTLPSSKAPDRLKKINNELSKIIKKHQPEILIIENLYFFKNLKTIIPVSQASGVILLTAAKNNLPVFGLTPPQVKLAITGFGRAEKKDVQEKIKTLLNMKELPRPDDAADALAIALAFYLKREDS
ncbi:MAG: crossover junction endodeoxyribonuclease RuvC [Candidatus Nealsonbacteria bacterium]|nr:crossover junction endodeoxyribonuclease RuvC [Candidatus Nealsonbacteria bacterium]